MTNIIKTISSSGAVQGVIIGAVLGWYTLGIIANIKAAKVNGWITIFGWGVPGNGMVLRAACVKIFPGPVNVPKEAMYWTTTKDGAGNKLNGKYDYIMHFPAGQLPPNNAFWSLTMGDAKQRFVPNPLNRYSVGDRSGLVPNADGSTDIYIRHTAPAGRESNWLPSPKGYFIPWLRVYEPGEAILNGKYQLPPIVRVQAQGATGRQGAIPEYIYTNPYASAMAALFAWVIYQHLSTGIMPLAVAAAIVWPTAAFLFIYFWPRLLLNVYKKAALVKGFGDGPIPINTLYTQPQALFADPLHATLSPGSSPLMSMGTNRDTLYVVGCLDLSKGPQILHVPDMAGRYYSVQFTDPSDSTNFAYVGKRVTGTKTGDYLITGPRWKGTMPQGMNQISSPNNSALVIGRVFVENDSDLSTAYNLSKQIQLTPLNRN